jgi:hypothetical protein
MGFSLIPSKPFSYVLEAHRSLPEDLQPWFRLRYLSARLFSDVADLLRTDHNRGAYVVVAASLVGWGRVEGDGAPVEFVCIEPGKKRLLHGIEVDGGAAAESLDRLPWEVVVELAAQVLEINQLDKGTAKN